jgi:transcriptional regulator with XRE-family HTH domain
VSFYDKFIGLCRDKNVKQSHVCTDIGINKSAASRWKNGGVPDGSTVLKICKYFDVPVSYFYEDEPPQEPPAEATKNDAPAAEKGDEYAEVIDLLTELRERSEMRMLFKLAKGATKEDVEQAVKIIEALRK